MTTKTQDKIMVISMNRKIQDIFDGRKLWEYRRSPPKLEGSILTIIYDSGKEKAMVGEFVTVRVLRKPLDELISETLHQSTSTKEGLTEYFSGLNTCSALRVESPSKYKSSLPLREIRELVSGFSPPQNFIYLRRESERDRPLFEAIMSLRR